MRTRLSRTARRDLEDILDWIAADNIQRALSFIDEIEARCTAIGESPHRFPIVMTVDGHGIRKRGYRNYVILYRIAQDEVQIDRIVHASRDWMRLIDEFL